MSLTIAFDLNSLSKSPLETVKANLTTPLFVWEMVGSGYAKLAIDLIKDQPVDAQQEILSAAGASLALGNSDQAQVAKAIEESWKTSGTSTKKFPANALR